MKEKIKEQGVNFKGKGIFARAAGITKENYAVIAALSTLAYSVLCLIYSSTFFAEFSINFYSFGNFPDIYKTLLSEHTGIAIILVVPVIYLAAILFLFPSKSNSGMSLERNYIFEYKFIKIDSIQLDIAIFGLFALITFFILSECYDNAKRSANHLKKGFSERYEIKTSNETLLCRTIIGSTSDYIFAFNHEENTPEAIPKSQINKIKMTILHAPPLFIIKNRRSSDSDFSHANQKLIVEQKNWSTELQQKCNQKVIWPANTMIP